VPAADLIRHWIHRLLDREHRPPAVLVAIWLADSAGAPPHSVAQAEALTGRGLEGDRYANGTGFWKATDGCQVTLIAEEDPARAERRHGIPLAAGEHRRNLVVRGLRPEAVRGRRLRIGGAFLAWHRPRPPCLYLDSITRRGTAKALGRDSGICLRVTEGGLIRVGDGVRVITSDRPPPADRGG
jgi:MOSC domain-containing protein YiiM